MVFAGMLPWTFFATGLSDATQSLIGNSSLIDKVYFPRLIVPTAMIVVALTGLYDHVPDSDRNDGGTIRSRLANPTFTSFPYSRVFR